MGSAPANGPGNGPEHGPSSGPDDGPDNTRSAAPNEASGDAHDEFVLYDLRVEVVAGDRPMVCNHPVGDYFELKGENLSLPPGQTFAVYPLAALLPLLPAKQRKTHQNDWMTTDTDIACPDPLCGGRFRITRTGVSTFRHGEVTKVPLPKPTTASPETTSA